MSFLPGLSRYSTPHAPYLPPLKQTKQIPIFLGEENGFAQIPFPLSEEQYALMMKFLELLKPVIVIEPAISSEIKAETREEQQRANNDISSHLGG